MLGHLPEIVLDVLLEIFNNILVNGTCPTSWSEATVIPTPKLGNDPISPDKCRPIALTSCMCKTVVCVESGKRQSANGILELIPQQCSTIVLQPAGQCDVKLFSFSPA